MLKSSTGLVLTIYEILSPILYFGNCVLYISSVLSGYVITSLWEEAAGLFTGVNLYVHIFCGFAVFCSSLSWCRGKAANFDCGTPWIPFISCLRLL